jgi:hypothetical protein
LSHLSPLSTEEELSSELDASLYLLSITSGLGGDIPVALNELLILLEVKEVFQAL